MVLWFSTRDNQRWSIKKEQIKKNNDTLAFKIEMIISVQSNRNNKKRSLKTKIIISGQLNTNN